ncbi:MAG: AAA-like domain-containing protein, partial [Firmicutes bacterium]|nr:AAA-like domain-containing protein [Bacillota bacterium]
MDRIFNVTGACNPKRHYMVDLTSRLEEIRKMIDRGDYFAINKGRQYGKTTILQAVTKYLKNDYVVINMDFQRLDSTAFESIQAFVSAFTTELLYYTENIPKEISDKLNTFIDGTARINSLQNMFLSLNMWCRKSDKPIVLIVDEVDGASNNQVFLDFLAQLRAG